MAAETRGAARAVEPPRSVPAAGGARSEKGGGPQALTERREERRDEERGGDTDEARALAALQPARVPALERKRARCMRCDALTCFVHHESRARSPRTPRQEPIIVKQDPFTFQARGMGAL
jgi:hypothetical protein